MGEAKEITICLHFLVDFLCSAFAKRLSESFFGYGHNFFSNFITLTEVFNLSLNISDCSMWMKCPQVVSSV